MVTIENREDQVLNGNGIAKAYVIDQNREKEIFRNMLSEDAIHKIIKVAKNPTSDHDFPHCTKPGDHGQEYIYGPPEWWTSGFFPGSLWAIYERSKRLKIPVSSEEVKRLAQEWANKIESQKTNTNTHDIGFLIMPAFARKYRLENDISAGEVIVQAAESLLTRWNERVGCIKSWDGAYTKAYDFRGPTDYAVIIDNMMNLDLLYEASIISGDSKYADIATKHADSTLKYHVREDSSTFHLVIFDSATGTRKVGLTCQGYQHESCWSRGQAWALYGFASAYQYTKQIRFLDIAKKLADYFLSRVDNGVVYWDFDAPRPCYWDISAAMIACSGMLLICELEGSREYVSAVASILQATQRGALTNETAVTILDHSTVNNYQYAFKRNFDTGLVYADYYYLEVGNRLIDMKLV
jgi:hypothetical protein